MNIIKTGIGLTKTIKNAARFKEILAVFARNGLDEFIIKTGIHEHIPNFVLPKSRISEAMQEFDEANEQRTTSSVAYRLRKSFEELGPCFIKFGQLLSTREDLFGNIFVDEMKKLLDQVKGFNIDEATVIIEESLGKKVEELFLSIDPAPIGMASMAVVFKAKLKTGQDVVIKIRRPGIVKTINHDIAILNFLVQRLEKMDRQIKFLGLSRLINDFAVNLKNETDFNVELLNCVKLKRVVEKWDEHKIFYLPDVYREYSRDNIFVMEYLDGTAFSQGQAVLAIDPDVGKKLIKGVHVFVDSLLVDGFFHADLHGGNFFLLKNGLIGIIDFGLVGNLGPSGRAALISILHNLLKHNYENLIYEFLDVTEYEKVPDIEGLIRDVRAGLAPFVGLTVQQTNLNHLLMVIFRTLSTHQIYLPREWFIIFRALMTLDGVGKSIGIDFDVYSIIENDTAMAVQKVFNKEEITNELLWSARDLVTLFRFLPRHFKWFMKDFAKNNYSFELINRGLDREVRGLKQALNNIAANIFASVLFIGGVMLVKEPIFEQKIYSIPVITLFFWLLAFGIFARTFFAIKRK